MNWTSYVRASNLRRRSLIISIISAVKTVLIQKRTKLMPAAVKSSIAWWGVWPVHLRSLSHALKMQAIPQHSRQNLRNA